jgi:hypothetical protein
LDVAIVVGLRQCVATTPKKHTIVATPSSQPAQIFGLAIGAAVSKTAGSTQSILRYPARQHTQTNGYHHAKKAS